MLFFSFFYVCPFRKDWWISWTTNANALRALASSSLLWMRSNCSWTISSVKRSKIRMLSCSWGWVMGQHQGEGSSFSLASTSNVSASNHCWASAVIELIGWGLWIWDSAVIQEPRHWQHPLTPFVWYSTTVLPSRSQTSCLSLPQYFNGQIVLVMFFFKKPWSSFLPISMSKLLTSQGSSGWALQKHQKPDQK